MCTRKQGGNQANDPDAISAERAAHIAGVSRRTIFTALKVMKKAPEVFEQMWLGNIDAYRGSGSNGTESRIQQFSRRQDDLSAANGLPLLLQHRPSKERS